MTSNRMKDLYATYKELLENDEYVIQDDIIKLLVEIESEIDKIMSSGGFSLSQKREKRYGLAKKNNTFHRTVAERAEFMKSEVGYGLSPHHMLGQVARRQEKIFDILEHCSYEDICKGSGIHYIKHTDGKTNPFVPSEIQEIRGGTSSEGQFENRNAPKFVHFLRLITEIETPEGGHIDVRDLVVDFQTETPENMFRDHSYLVIRIPRLNRMVLLNDRIGEGTYIIPQNISLEEVKNNTKTELQNMYGARMIPYKENWSKQIIHALTHSWEVNESDVPSENIGEKNKISHRVSIKNASLFMDPFTIQKNLCLYAGVAGISPSELSTGTPKAGTLVELSNGVNMRWATFLRNASQYIFDTKGSIGQPYRGADALNRLKEMVDEK